MRRQRVAHFFSLLWKEYNYQLLLVIASLTSLIVESLVASSWSPWRIAPQLLLLICLVYFVRSAHEISRSSFPAPQLPYSICIGKAYSWFDNFARRQQEQCLTEAGVRWDYVQRTFRIHQSDWAFVSSDRIAQDSGEWIRVTHRLLQHFWDLQKRVEAVPVYHFFFIAPPTIVFAFGAHVGRRVPHFAYHHVGNIRHPYLVAIDTTTRDTSQGLDLLNQRIPEPSFTEIAIDRKPLGSSGNIIVTLDFTNHKTSPPFPNQDAAKELVRVTHHNGIGHIPSTGWERLARELASLLLDYCDNGAQLDLYINTPLVLAFAIGSIVGPVRGIMLCEYNVYLQEFVRCLELASPQVQTSRFALEGPAAGGP
jgi:hypothetical protein